MAEDDFRRWEHEFEPGAPKAAERSEGPFRESSGGRGVVVAAGVIAFGCAGVIALGDVPLGAAGLVLAALILVLWRIGM
ncbi:hypothetical protein ACFOY4_33290 [Actinomadura syzygii]|uniref:Uncharacterized protein n=1 Tax=Actinomadura syzygii TaxID=1427538 RepID=A0A5D0UBP4_9ACTN|nr:hypothetical protein [Actinomadura syzygii]TYC15055.1 hypothetical protein FXF65_13105 [Actinomadura syzygii]